MVPISCPEYGRDLFRSCVKFGSEINCDIYWKVFGNTKNVNIDSFVSTGSHTSDNIFWLFSVAVLMLTICYKENSDVFVWGNGH